MAEIIRADLHNRHHGEALVALLDEYARDEMGGGSPLADEVKANLAQALAARSGAHVLLAWVDDQPVGVATCFEGFSTFACRPLVNVHDVVVKEQFRGLGLSQKMLQKVEEIARQRGCCKITLEVLEGNPVAQGSYRKFGFSDGQLDPAHGRMLFWNKYL